jgi:hypothetical protein
MGYSVFPAATAASGMANPTIQQTFNATFNTATVPAGIGNVKAILVSGGQGGQGTNRYNGNAGGAGRKGGVLFGETAFTPVGVVGGGGGGSGYTNDEYVGPSAGSIGGTTTYGTLEVTGNGTRVMDNITFSGFTGNPGNAGNGGSGGYNGSSGGNGGGGSITLMY